MCALLNSLIYSLKNAARGRKKNLCLPFSFPLLLRIVVGDLAQTGETQVCREVQGGQRGSRLDWWIVLSNSSGSPLSAIDALGIFFPIPKPSPPCSQTNRQDSHDALNTDKCRMPKPGAAMRTIKSLFEDNWKEVRSE